jgi:hypothetical protein
MSLRPSGIHGAIGTHCVVTNFALTETVYSPEFKIARHFHERACFYAVLQGAVTESFGKSDIESNVSLFCSYVRMADQLYLCLILNPHDPDDLIIINVAGKLRSDKNFFVFVPTKFRIPCLCRRLQQKDDNPRRDRFQTGR